MSLKKRIHGFVPVLVLGLLLCTGAVRADQQELQLGYIYDYWNSNSLFHGSEQRIPLSYYLSSPNFSLSVNTSFVSGDYVEDADPAYNVTGNAYQSSELSDTSLNMNLGIDMGNSTRSTITGILNIPTGDNRWELLEQANAIPVIFEPSYYHGAGWGGDLFYTFSLSNPGVEYAAGLGFMSTATYDTGLSAQGTFSPGDSLVALATVGFTLSPVDTWSFRYLHTFPLESTYDNPNEDFTEGAANIFSTQWTRMVGKDKLVVNASYSYYGTGSGAGPNAPYPLVENQGPYLGDKLELHPIFGYSMGPGVTFESGLAFDFIQPNGYSGPPLAQVGFQGGGTLLGVEQSATIQLTEGTFWNIAGLYHTINNVNVPLISNGNGPASYGTITYQQFTLGTNVGIKW